MSAGRATVEEAVEEAMIVHIRATTIRTTRRGVASRECREEISAIRIEMAGPSMMNASHAELSTSTRSVAEICRAVVLL